MSSDRAGTDLCAEFIACRSQLRDAAARILGSRERAEDVIQDAYFKIVEVSAANEIREPVAFLFQVVRNLAIDRQRRLSMESVFFAEEDEGMQVSSGASGPEATVISRETLARVAAALATLPARTLSAFEMHRLDGCTQKEVAEKLGVSTTLVNFMIRDALNCCREIML
ncbi:RNA polymerase factor sigma-70 [Herbaspirillum rhizosphaerae]|uniref:RNA polymerase factor sigma-70 n=1 Tax=Herbaspirillum rhizosphaerae TaxID=346179 RepID=UPI00067AABAA|nr:RNA polymerase factor sigma-70 [Herbaspirillum rhizosphaerae]